MSFMGSIADDFLKKLLAAMAREGFRLKMKDISDPTISSFILL